MGEGECTIYSSIIIIGYVMSCHVMSCPVMSCHVMSCELPRFNDFLHPIVLFSKLVLMDAPLIKEDERV